MTESDLRHDVEEKLEELRAAIRRYRQSMSQPPRFMLEERAKKLPSDKIENCKLFAGREELVRHFATGKIGAEVGTQRGIFSNFLLENTDVSTLHLFDLSDDLMSPEVLADDRTVFHKGNSAPNLTALQDVTFDWIYIDGDHSLRGVKDDARAALQRTKPGGVLFFNDYTIWSPMEAIPYGVITAVNELVVEGHEMIGLALSPHGYFDVALRISA